MVKFLKYGKRSLKIDRLRPVTSAYCLIVIKRQLRNTFCDFIEPKSFEIAYRIRKFQNFYYIKLTYKIAF